MSLLVCIVAHVCHLHIKTWLYCFSNLSAGAGVTIMFWKGTESFLEIQLNPGAVEKSISGARQGFLYSYLYIGAGKTCTEVES